MSLFNSLSSHLKPAVRAVALAAVAAFALPSEKASAIAVNATTGAALPLTATSFTAPSAWTRGATNTTYALWADSFNSSSANASANVNRSTDNANDVVWNGIAAGAPGSNYAAANIYAQSGAAGWDIQPVQFNGVTFTGTGPTRNSTTSTQHFYGGVAAGGNPVQLQLTIPGLGLGGTYTTSFRVMINTAEDVFPANGFSLSIDGGAASAITPTLTNLNTGATSGAGFYDYAYEFTVPGNAATYGLSLYSGTGTIHTAVNALAVDTSAVPEPATAGLLAAAACGLVARRRRA